MKFQLKTLALVAATLVAGAAHADVQVGTDSVSGSFSILAYNTVTNAYYIRDLGYTINQFLPSTITTKTADGGGVGITGDKTPAAGLTLDKTTNANFGDSSFATWLASQTASDVKWSVQAVDSQSTNTTTNVSRMILSAPGSIAPTNGQITNAVGTINGLSGYNTGSNPVTGTGLTASFTDGFGLTQAAVVSALDTVSNLFYFTRTTATGSSGVSAAATQYGNVNGFATVSLASNGDFKYELAGAPVSAVPLPAAAWLMGVGLVGFLGAARRRKAGAAAA